MTIDDLKTYSVIVEGGSGCLFQPSARIYTYVLTAKHNLRDKNDGDSVQITILNKNAQGDWSEEIIPFIKNSENNCFVHLQADAAILLIPYRDNCGHLFIEHDLSTSIDYSLCGYPFDKRVHGENKIFWFKNHLIRQFTDSKLFFQGALIEKNQNQENIVGISGGGVMKPWLSHLTIVGIQSEISKSDNPEGEIDFVPIQYFEEIVTNSKGKLSLLLPPFISSFSFLRDEIMKLEECLDKTLVAQVRNQLQLQADQIDLVPLDIIQNLKAKMLIVNEKESSIYSKGLWVSWLEYLVVLHIISEQKITIEELHKNYNSKRLIHSDTEKNWIEIIKEILESDYSDVSEESVVIVSTKTKPRKTVIKKGLIENIARVNEVRLNIDQATQLKNIAKFIHIKAFQTDCIENNEEELSKFKGLEIGNIVAALKTKFNEFLQSRD